MNIHSFGQYALKMNFQLNEQSSSKLYSSQTYSKSVLSGFFKLRSSISLCDVTLCAEDKSFKAHRALLASSCDYFRGE